ncbi:MAG TPA: hypothetical protein VFF67_01880 [Thermoplasmata archaeon]|nr:hypothetical protein [Thermoplasmata archaeon]
MAGHAVAFWSSGTGSHVELWTHLFHRYFLPVVGVASVVLGVGWFLGVPGAFNVYAPWVLLVGGVGMLTCVLSILGSSRPPGLAHHPTPRPHLAEAPYARTRLSDSYLVPSPDPIAPHPSRSRAVASSPPLAAMAAPEADFVAAMWDGWGDNVGSLPVELVGPVAQTAYVPPKDGEFAPFPELDPEPPMFLEGPLPYSDPFPSEADIPMPLTPPIAEEARPIPRPIPLTAVELEALMPLPPHLRSVAEPLASDPFDKELPPVPDVSIVFCATCAVAIEPGTRRSNCGRCGELVCGQCEFDALMTHGQEWCADCAPAPEVDVSLQTGYLPGA